MTNGGQIDGAAVLPGEVVERPGPPEQALRCAGRRCPFLTYERRIVYGCFCRAKLGELDAALPYPERRSRLDERAAVTPPEPLYREYRCAACLATFKARRPAMFCPVCLGDAPGMRRRERARR